MQITLFSKILTIATFAVLLIPNLQATDIQVFAAASLTDSLKKIAVEYEKKTGDMLLFNFAASSLLERQIEEGAPAD